MVYTTNMYLPPSLGNQIINHCEKPRGHHRKGGTWVIQYKHRNGVMGRYHNQLYFIETSIYFVQAIEMTMSEVMIRSCHLL